MAVTAVVASADVAIGKTALATVLATSNLSYTISVTNFGPSTAGSVVVTDTLPAGVTYVSASGGGVANAGVVTWSVGALTNSQTTNLTLIVTAPVSGSLTNVATVSTPTGDPVLTNNVTAPVVTGVTPVTDIIVLNVGPGSVVAGTTYTNVISVTNAGPSTATNVVVVDTLPNGVTVTNSYPTLAAGSGTNFTVTYTAPGSGSLTNAATGTSGTFDPQLGNNTNIVAVTAVVASADLQILNAGPGSVVAGTLYTNVVTVTNLGPSVATNVVVVDTLPNGVTVTRLYARLGVGFATNFMVTYVAPGAGSLTNVATCTSGTFDPNIFNNTNVVVTDVIASADVVVGKSGPSSVTYGTNFSYTISVTNFGPSLVASLFVTDSLPAGLVFVSASPGWTTNGNQVVWTNLVNLASGATTNLTLTVFPTASITVTNFAKVGSPTSDPNLINNTSPPLVTTIVPAPLTIVAGNTNKLYNTTLTLGAGQTAFTPIGLVNEETIGSVTLASAGATNTAAVGTYPLVPSGATGGTFNPANYGITYSNGLLTVSAGIYTTGWPVVTNIVYGTPLGTNQNSATANVPGNFSYNPTNGVVLPVGTNVLTVLFTPTDTNYLATPLTNSVVVTPASLVVSANNQVRGYSQTNPPLTYMITGFVNSETTNVITGSAALNTSAVSNSPAGIYPITIGQGTLVAANYSFTFTNGLLTVTNVPPVANAQSVATSINTAKLITLTGSDPANLPLTYFIVSNPAHGTLSLFNTNTGTVIYTPSTNYTGGDSFTFSVNNGQTNSAPATVSINVSATSGADVQVTLFGPALATVGDVFSFTNSVTNAGPATAVNTRVTNALPANLTFASASGGGVYSNGVVTWPVFPSLASGQVTNLIVSVKTTTSGSTITPTANPLNFLLTNAPPTVSSATNRASAYATTFDPNLTNNIASAFYTNAQAQTLIVPGAFSVVLVTNTYPTNAMPTNTIIPIGTGLFIVGTSAFNPQTQLYEEFVTVTNIGQAPVHALRLSIGSLRSGVKLYNATGTNNGVPYVEYDPPYNSPLNPYPQANSSVTFVLEFFVADRRPFTNSLTAVAINAPPPANVTGTSVQIIQYGFNDQRSPGNPRYLVQFTSIPGRTYTVQYSDDNMATWNNATPSILASATSTFWYDDGPPVTVSPPPNLGGSTSRFYRVLLNP